MVKNGSSEKNWLTVLRISSEIATILIAVVALFVAVQSHRVAEESYELSYQSSLPTISAITETYPNDEGLLSTEKMMVYNNGEPINLKSAEASRIMEVSFSDKGIITYIPLFRYFEEPLGAERSGYSRGLLLTAYLENNYSAYNSIKDDFSEAAFEDGYESLEIWDLSILKISYDDYRGQYLTEYFWVDSHGSRDMDESYAEGILDSADGIDELASDTGLMLFNWQARGGQELWDWYKEAILEDFS